MLPNIIIRHILLYLNLISFVSFIRTCKTIYSQSKYTICDILEKYESQIKEEQNTLKFDPCFPFNINISMIYVFVEMILKKYDLYLKFNCGEKSIFMNCEDNFNFCVKSNKNKYHNSMYPLKAICDLMNDCKFPKYSMNNIECKEWNFIDYDLEFICLEYFKDEVVKQTNYIVPTKGSFWEKFEIGKHFEIDGIIFSICNIFGQKYLSCCYDNNFMDLKTIGYLKNNPSLIILKEY